MFLLVIVTSRLNLLNTEILTVQIATSPQTCAVARSFRSQKHLSPTQYSFNLKSLRAGTDRLGYPIDILTYFVTATLTSAHSKPKHIRIMMKILEFNVLAISVLV